MFAKVKNNICVVYPYSEFELKQDNPYTQYVSPINLVEIFPLTEQATLHGYELVEVRLADMPAYDERTEKLLEGQPAKNQDGWAIPYIVEKLTVEEQKNRYDNVANSVRQKRNRLLAQCDWTQVADAPVDKAAWATYRQELRDITTQEGFPWAIIWPTEPTGV